MVPDYKLAVRRLAWRTSGRFQKLPVPAGEASPSSWELAVARNRGGTLWGARDRIDEATRALNLRGSGGFMPSRGWQGLADPNQKLQEGGPWVRQPSTSRSRPQLSRGTPT